MKLRKYTILTLFLFLFSTLCLNGCASSRPEPATPYDGTVYIRESELLSYDLAEYETIPTNPNGSLSVPTYITKLDDQYFIVDCYHNQVIYNENLTDPLYLWKVMTNDLSMGHTIASDGNVYLIDDTENNRVLIMEKMQNNSGETVYVPTQEFTGIGNRPHYIIYDDYTDTFYAWSSQSGEMFLFRHTDDSTRMYLTKILSIPELDGVYVRSFTILDDRIYVVSGNSNIIEADLYTFEVLNRYPVPDAIAGMIQLEKIQNYYYITVSTDITGNQDFATLIRVKNLRDLEKGNYEDVYASFLGGGTPYSLTQIDDRYYLTEHRLPGHSIWSFRVENDEITDVEAVY